MGNVRWGKEVYGMMRYLKRVDAGRYRLEWQDDVVDVRKEQDIGYARWYVYVNDQFRYDGKSFNAALDWVDNVWGNEPVKTSNLCNRAAGEFDIARKNYGGCTDPGTETYWSM